MVKLYNACESRMVVVLIVLIIFSSCGITHHSTNHPLTLMNDYCQPATTLVNFRQSDYHNADSLLNNDTVLSKSLSVHSIMMSNVTGTLPLIKRLLTNIKDTSLEGRVRGMQMQQQLQQEMAIARLEIESISAELDCEAERTNRIINYLNNKGSKRTNRLTVAAIITGSVTTLIPIIIKSSRPQNAAVITGAGISLLIGIAALKPNPNIVKLTYERNLLSDIWYGPKQSTVFPEFIWLMLTQKEFNHDQQISVRENMKKRWMNLEFNKGSIDPETEKLLFAHGGAFTSDDLQTRYNLLKQTQAAIMLMSKDVEAFLADVNKLF